MAVTQITLAKVTVNIYLLSISSFTEEKGKVDNKHPKLKQSGTMMLSKLENLKLLSILFCFDRVFKIYE